ncbi:MAG: ROK family glucokinase, partial [Nocardioidaceae bacterium]
APRAVEDTIVAAVSQLRATHPVAAVGIGAAGFVDASRTTVLFSPHLSWRNEPLRDALFGRLRIPVIVDNDANMAAWAECRFGAGIGRSQVLCLTLGTGIGGALVIDGRVLRGANGIAGEFGHMQVVPDGKRCECGNRGCWEQYASGNALVREAGEMVVSRAPVAHRLRELTEDNPARLTGQLVTEAASQGDPTSIELITDVGRWLGVGLANLSAAFDPDCIIVGGGVAEAGDLLLGPARDALARTLTGRGFRPTPSIVAASLGPDAGMVGAADMARSAVRRSRRSPRRRARRQRKRRVRLQSESPPGAL